MIVYHSSLLVVSSWGHLASRAGAKAQCLRMVDFSQTSMLGMIIVFLEPGSEGGPRRNVCLRRVHSSELSFHVRHRCTY